MTSHYEVRILGEGCAAAEHRIVGVEENDRPLGWRFERLEDAPRCTQPSHHCQVQACSLA